MPFHSGGQRARLLLDALGREPCLKPRQQRRGPRASGPRERRPGGAGGAANERPPQEVALRGGAALPQLRGLRGAGHGRLAAFVEGKKWLRSGPSWSACPLDISSKGWILGLCVNLRYLI